MPTMQKYNIKKGIKFMSDAAKANAQAMYLLAAPYMRDWKRC